VEVHKNDLLHLPDVLAALRAAPQRFLLFCDDLSFDESEVQYRELKAALEGSLAAPPANVRIVATSNRRHLLPERMEENRAAHLDEQGELRLTESLEEKLALSRWAVPGSRLRSETYLAIVEHYAKQAGRSRRPAAPRRCASPSTARAAWAHREAVQTRWRGGAGAGVARVTLAWRGRSRSGYLHTR
jgi:predicted AAA+ superfamily ATPase